MKKILLSVIAIAMAHISFAQWATLGTNINSTNSGNVGIGTTSPTNKLDVRGEIRTISGGTNGSRIGSDAAGFFISNDDGSTNPLRIFGGANNTQYMTISPNGSVGIGTTNPNAILQVTGTVSTGGGYYANIDPALKNLSYMANSGQMLIGWNRTSGAGETAFISNQGGGSTGGFAFSNYSNSGTETQLMWIQGNGNVGIGTKSPDQKLTVNGTIHSKEVKVDLNVPAPDYVFEQDYKLADLNDLKAYVDKNHHLPEIPSADAMAKNGINLSEMNMKLLKKVEELTLYLIEKANQVDNQNKQIINQQKQNDQQEARIAALEKASLSLTAK